MPLDPGVPIQGKGYTRVSRGITNFVCSRVINWPCVRKQSRTVAELLLVLYSTSIRPGGYGGTSTVLAYEYSRSVAAARLQYRTCALGPRLHVPYDIAQVTVPGIYSLPTPSFVRSFVRSFGDNPVPSHTIPDAYEYGTRYKLCLFKGY